MVDPAPIFLLVIIILLLPPIGVLMLAGIGPDFLINVLLTILGYFPGHIHAFYLLYIFYDRRSKARTGMLTGNRAPGIFSEDIQEGGIAPNVIRKTPATVSPARGFTSDVQPIGQYQERPEVRENEKVAL